MSIQCNNIITKSGDVDKLLEELQTQNFLQNVKILELMNKVETLSTLSNINMNAEAYAVSPNLIGTWKVSNELYFTIDENGIFTKVGGLYPGTYNPNLSDPTKLQLKYNYPNGFLGPVLIYLHDQLSINVGLPGEVFEMDGTGDNNQITLRYRYLVYCGSAIYGCLVKPIPQEGPFIKQ